MAGARPARGTRDEHPLLQLQRAAGNVAVSELVLQRRNKEYRSAGLALGRMERLYAGLCDADLSAVAVRKKWSRGLLARDVSIVFERGPVSFSFDTSVPYFGDRFPWSFRDRFWVTEPIERALDAISGDIDDAGPRFWQGRKTIVDTLRSDLEHFCAKD